MTCRALSAVSVLAAVLVAGCTRPVTPAGPASGGASGAAPDTSSAPVVTLDRTPCYGTCPDYTVATYADGRVVFDGRQFVARTGRAEARVAPAVVAGLVAQSARINHAGFPERLMGPDVCETEATDNPSATTTVRTPAGTSHVVHYRGCYGFRGKAELSAFEDAIDRDLGTAAWVGGSDPAGAQ